jgi:ABC-type dipeptide/oligopeptide/nickel transport system permease subunit
MNNATEFPSAVSEPKRRNIRVDFLIRLATEKPLGTFGGIIVLIFILVAIFADILAPRLALWPGLCLTIVVYSLNMFGDALRDLLDPRLRGGEGSYGIAKVKRKRGLLDRLISPFNW